MCYTCIFESILLLACEYFLFIIIVIIYRHKYAIYDFSKYYFSYDILAVLCQTAEYIGLNNYLNIIVVI